MIVRRRRAQIRNLENQITMLNERLDFTEQDLTDQVNRIATDIDILSGEVIHLFE